MSAASLKEEGNAALKAGRTSEAVDFYSRAIKLEPRNHLLYSNRAAALAVLGKFEEALNDASQVVVLEPLWLKGHVRKGAALRSLERHAESIAAYQQALRLEPGNVQVQAALREVEALQRDSGRNWADDLESSEEDDAPAKPQQQVHKRARTDGGGPSNADSGPHAGTLAGVPPKQSEVKRLQQLINESNGNTLRACLLQLARSDAATCDRVCEMLEQLADKSSEGEGEGGDGSDASSGDSDDV